MATASRNGRTPEAVRLEIELDREGLETAVEQLREAPDVPHQKTCVELLRLELKTKATAVGLGIGAALLALYGLGFLFATIAVALAIVLDTWLALLIVFGALLLLGAVLALVGMSMIKKATPPVPEQTVAEARLTTEALRSNGSHE